MGSGTNFVGVRTTRRHLLDNVKYQAHISIKKKLTLVGTFDTAEEAARAYDKAAREEFGNRAIQNFPDPNPAWSYVEGFPGVRKILLTQGKEAWVDEADYTLVSEYKWHAHRPSNSQTFYAVAYLPTPRGAPQKQIRMHQLLTPEWKERGMVIDHLDQNGLNNRRSNLRLVTASLSVRNKTFKNKTGYRGVSTVTNPRNHKRINIKPFAASISFGRGANVYLGVFNTAIEAAQAYDREAKARLGKEAVLNFPAKERS